MITPIYNLLSRVDWIRTSDHLHPMQVRYRAAPPPEPVRKYYFSNSGIGTANVHDNFATIK